MTNTDPNILTIVPVIEYILDIDNDGERPTYAIADESPNSAFSAECSSVGPKIYMVTDTYGVGTIQYVGETRSSIPNRFKESFRKSDKGDHKNYLWASQPGKRRLFVWNLKGYAVQKPFLRCIETELALAVRILQLSWPIFQRRIQLFHFRQNKVFADSFRIASIMMGQYIGLLEKRFKDGEHEPYLLKDKKRVESILAASKLFE